MWEKFNEDETDEGEKSTTKNRFREMDSFAFKTSEWDDKLQEALDSLPEEYWHPDSTNEKYFSRLRQKLREGNIISIKKTTNKKAY